MPRNLSIAALCLAAGGLLATAAAQTIYRCGDSYGQQPCPGGTVVPAHDKRDAAQRAQTSAAAQRDAKAADALEKARLKEEATPAQAYIPPSKAPAAGREDSQAAPAGNVRKPAVFKATAPAKPGQAAAKKAAKKKSKNAKKKAKKNAA